MASTQHLEIHVPVKLSCLISDLVSVQGSLDNINLFSCITIISFFLLLPVALLTEGVRFTPGAMRAAGLDPSVVMKQALLAAACFHSYQQVRGRAQLGHKRLL